MSIIAIYPGTFDPMTNGHIDIVKRSLRIFDIVIIGVADNLNKKPLLTVNERINIIENDIYKNEINLDKVKVKSVKGLLIRRPK